MYYEENVHVDMYYNHYGMQRITCVNIMRQTIGTNAMLILRTTLFSASDGADPPRSADDISSLAEDWMCS